MSGRSQAVSPLQQTPTAITGTCTDSYVSVKTDFFYVKSHVHKLFKILNTHATRGMKYRVRACSSLSGGAMVNPKIIGPETVLPGGLTDPEIESCTEPYNYMDVQVANQTAGQNATYHVEAEFASI